MDLNFSSSLLFSFELSDIVVVLSNGTEYHAHKFVMAMNSPVLRTMFSQINAETTSNRLYIDDVDPETVYDLFVYMYTGRITNALDIQLLYCATKYQMDKLIRIIENSLINTINASNISLLIGVCDIYRLPSLEKEIFDFIISNFDWLPMQNIYEENNHLSDRIKNKLWEFKNKRIYGYFSGKMELEEYELYDSFSSHHFRVKYLPEETYSYNQVKVEKTREIMQQQELTQMQVLENSLSSPGHLVPQVNRVDRVGYMRQVFHAYQNRFHRTLTVYELGKEFSMTGVHKVSNLGRKLDENSLPLKPAQYGMLLDYSKKIAHIDVLDENINKRKKDLQNAVKVKHRYLNSQRFKDSEKKAYEVVICPLLNESKCILSYPDISDEWVTSGSWYGSSRISAYNMILSERVIYPTLWTIYVDMMQAPFHRYHYWKYPLNGDDTHINSEVGIEVGGGLHCECEYRRGKGYSLKINDVDVTQFHLLWALCMQALKRTVRDRSDGIIVSHDVGTTKLAVWQAEDVWHAKLEF